MTPHSSSISPGRTIGTIVASPGPGGGPAAALPSHWTSTVSYGVDDFTG